MDFKRADDQRLTEILKKYPQVLTDRQKLQALFMDYFPEDKRIRNTLLIIFDEGIVSEMGRIKQMDKQSYYRFVHAVEEDYGIKKENAELAVTMWGNALQIPFADDVKTDDLEQKVTQEVEWKEIEESVYYEYEEVKDGIRITRYLGFDEPEITIPNMIDGKKVKEIGKSVFANCIGINKIIITEGIEVLGDRAFGGCKALKEAVLPDTLRAIGDAAFAGCESLKEIELPNDLKNIGVMSFQCSGLVTITVPPQVEYMGDRCFYSCKKLKHVVLPEDLLTICDYTFAFCTDLENVVFPRKLKIIKDSAFLWCKSLETVKLYDNLEEIGKEVFKECYNLKIYIPDSVRKISNWAFGYSSSEVIIYCNFGSYALQYARQNNIKYKKWQHEGEYR